MVPRRWNFAVVGANDEQLQTKHGKSASLVMAGGGLKALRAGPLKPNKHSCSMARIPRPPPAITSRAPFPCFVCKCSSFAPTTAESYLRRLPPGPAAEWVGEMHPEHSRFFTIDRPPDASPLQVYREWKATLAGRGRVAQRYPMRGRLCLHRTRQPAAS